ncbi:MAG: queuosine precursor transporter [Planctomycetota bacterium]
MSTPLPSQQHVYPGLPALTEANLHARRETLFLLFAGLFLGTLAMLNVLGISRFIVLASYSSKGGFDWGSPGELTFAVAAGVLPYPLTFLCTDFISELWGKARANAVVWIGLLLNLFVLSILYVATELPGFMPNDAVTGYPPMPAWNDEKQVFEETGWTLFQIKHLAFGATAASMIAYLIAQLVDVHVFHFWKKLTKGKHLWLRNNGSTLVSQLVDTIAVILITHFYAHALPIDADESLTKQLLLFIVTGYMFKLVAALFDTPIFYAGSYVLRRYLRLPPPQTEASVDA